MKKVFLALALLGALFTFTACSNSSSGGGGPEGGSVVWTYYNKSSKTVTFIPQANSIPAGKFEIAAGTNATVTWLDSRNVTFSWWPFPGVKADYDFDGKKCVFLDDN